jgi:hypothetical protein
MADAPVVQLAAKLLGRAVEEGALFSGEGDGADAAEPRPVWRAGEELGVPADGAGFERLTLGLRDRGHGALQRAIGGHHHVVVLEAREGERKQAAGDEPTENCPEIEHRRVQMARAEAHLQAQGEEGNCGRPGPKGRTVHGKREQRRKRQKREDELSHGDSPTDPLPLPALRPTVSKPLFL